MTTRTCISLVLATALAASVHAAEPAAVSPARTTAEAGLVEIRTQAPGIALDIRYATANNFTGQRVPGYARPACYLLPAVADALAKVERHLHHQGHALQVYDCYRPVRSVQAFVAWAQDPGETSRKTVQYPDLEKSQLIADGYIAAHSGHSRAATVDVGLMRCGATMCTPLDLGTDFDFFGTRAHTDAAGLSAPQLANRRRLLQAMAAEDFVNYPKEWWHFTFQPEPDPQTAYDVPVE